MSGLLFDYHNGNLQVEFRHSKWAGDIDIIFHLYSDSVLITPCDEQFQKGTPVIHSNGDVQLSCWTSSSVSSFFQRLINWLEAVTCNVAECAFSWEGEGPDGELRWFNRYQYSGRLQLTWTGRHDSAEFERSVFLNKYQMVQAIYQSFRNFVMSDRYNPLKYERLLLGEAIDVIVLEGCETLIQALPAYNHATAEALIQTIVDTGYRDENDLLQRLSLSEILPEIENGQCAGSENHMPEKQADSWLDHNWDHWTHELRLVHLKHILNRYTDDCGFGERLRDLRSPLVEKWLAESDSEAND